MWGLTSVAWGIARLAVGAKVGGIARLAVGAKVEAAVRLAAARGADDNARGAVDSARGAVAFANHHICWVIPNLILSKPPIIIAFLLTNLLITSNLARCTFPLEFGHCFS